jgi:hypothetical protein
MTGISADEQTLANVGEGSRLCSNWQRIQQAHRKIFLAMNLRPARIDDRDMARLERVQP